MSLDIGSGSGRPYVKYNAKSGRWYVRGDNGQDVEIQAPTCIIDFDNIATGWFLFREGQAPDRAIDPAWAPGRRSPRPITSAASWSCAIARSTSAARSKCPARRCISATPSKMPMRALERPRRQYRPRARLRLYRDYALQGQVRHELQADVAAGEVGRPARRPAGRAGRADGHSRHRGDPRHRRARHRERRSGRSG